LWDDMDAAHQYMLGRGVIPTEIQTRNDGQKAFYVDDRAGNRIELCTKSGSVCWSSAGSGCIQAGAPWKAR
jgi:hypothetical protein